MKALNYIEIQKLCNELNKLTGTQLQRVSSDENKIYLLFWDGEQSSSWLIDLNQKLPVILPYDKKIPKKNIKKPWISFLAMHFSGSILEGARPKSIGERVIELSFKNVEKGEQKIIINLFPKGVNLILSSANKQVSKFKVKNFPAIGDVPEGLAARNIDEILQNYNEKPMKKEKAQLSPEDHHGKETKKIEKSIKKIIEDVESKKNKVKELQAVGDYIKCNQTLEVPEGLKKYINFELSVYENMNIAFEKGKKEKSKLDGADTRLVQLKSKLEVLGSVENYDAWFKSINKKTTGDLKLKRDQKLKFKTVNLDSSYKVLLGSSAKNNSELIKASKPWYIWMHLRDYPSSHAVVICEKNEEVKRGALIEAGKELIKHNFKSKKIKYEGLKFDLIFCQIRYLRQIKASPGKVTYTNDKNLTIQM